MTAASVSPGVGWLGKLPSTGDFASRRLDPAQVASLDEWLSTLMLSLRERDAEGWLAAYLASPSWRFLWMPNAMPAPWRGRAWIGVVIPSVDRVGRYFPLALIQALAELPKAPARIDAVWRWLQRLDEIAADALEGDWTIDALEAQLARLGAPIGADGGDAADDEVEDPDATITAPLEPLRAPSSESLGTAGSSPRSTNSDDAPGAPRRIDLRAHATPAAALAAQAHDAWAHAHGDRCYWYCATEHFEPTLITTGGVADHALALALFGPSRDAG